MLRKRFRRTFIYVLYVMAVLFITSFTYTLLLRWIPPITTPLMVIRGGESREGKGDMNFYSKWCSMGKISNNAKLAVIAAEDWKFATHSGFDYEAMEKAFRSNLKENKPLRGGSTISQQVAKNIFLWPGSGWTRYIRKIPEAYFTFLIELLWPKERILQMYLNIAEMGDGIFGIEAAAQRYFKKPALQLTAAESAAIAAILPNPRRYSATKPSQYISKRKASIQRAINILKREKYLEQL